MKTKLSVFIMDPIKSLNMQTDLRAVSIHVLIIITLLKVFKYVNSLR